ncbi:MAG TPA: prolyl oligopeptidase family serine peptidase [Armatimonadota bacterium]|nr:prolyl oligopeptidase family serine peptidase [Armatimonadota bacterium]
MRWIVAGLTLAGALAAGAADRPQRLPADLAPYFRPPARYAGDFGPYRSPLKFADGRPVKNAADWKKRREEILRAWHGIMGAWPPLIESPRIQVLGEERREGLTQKRVRLPITPNETTDAYLLVPDGARRAPAVLVVYYEPETGIGRSDQPLRDFALQLAKRGFVTLSVGHQPSIYYPSEANAVLQPLSGLAYGAANCCNALAALPEVDPKRIGIVGHSYGGKWAMFASCLYDRFACAAWSDPGIVWDEGRPNVNYWDPWYLGYEPGKKRPRGAPTPENPRTGAYKQLYETGHDLHELHALMAPRPFLVSGGSEDPPERWKALNHAIAVNRLLGCEDRVAMTNRPAHPPTAESNEQLYRFFEHFLK